MDTRLLGSRFGHVRRAVAVRALGAVLLAAAAVPALAPAAGAQPAPPDADADGLYDDDERYVYGTDPANPDTDGDGAGDAYDGAPLTWTPALR